MWLWTFNFHEIFECAHYSKHSVQTSNRTNVRTQCSHASVGLTQAYPSNTAHLSYVSLFQIDTIAGIRHSAIQGHSIVMIQTDEIHESFYDLFNQRFQKIDDPTSGTRLYANIAIGAHLKPCRVDPKFQCVVAIKKSELDQTPAPFLNRFEKYYITHKSILESVLRSLPVGLQSVIEAVYKKVRLNLQFAFSSVFIVKFEENYLKGSW